MLPFAKPTGYGLGKSGWVSGLFEADAKPPVDMLLAWLDESYRAIAPKKLVAQLGATRQAAPSKATKAVKPAKATKPAEAAKPAKVTKPAEAAKPAKATKAVKPAKATKAPAKKVATKTAAGAARKARVPAK